MGEKKEHLVGTDTKWGGEGRGRSLKTETKLRGSETGTLGAFRTTFFLILSLHFLLTTHSFLGCLSEGGKSYARGGEGPKGDPPPHLSPSAY
jgi:hypothetical protein